MKQSSDSIKERLCKELVSKIDNCMGIPPKEMSLLGQIMSTAMLRIAVQVWTELDSLNKG